MKLDFKSSAVLGVVVLALVMAAYWAGVSQSPLSTGVVASENAQPSIPAGHPNIKFSHFRVGNRNVKGMLADGDLVWVGTSGGLLRYDLKTDDYNLFDVANGSLISNGVFHVSRLDDKIVVGTYGGGMSVYDTKSNKWKNYNIPDGLADQFVYDVQRVSNGDIWIATWSGANRVKGGNLDDPKQWETFNPENTHGGLPNEWVYGFEEGLNGDLWFATEKGLARYRDGQWTNWKHDDGLGAPYDLVKADNQFTTDPGSASRHHAQQKADQGLENVTVAYNPNYVVSLKVDKRGVVWAGTWGAGLSRFDGKTWRNFTVKDGLPGNHIFMLHMDGKGRIWAGTNQGLARVEEDGNRFVVFKRQDGLYADNVFSMAQANDGTVWVGSFGGVARLAGAL